MHNKSALVTDGIWRKTLAVVRGLASSGVKVAVGERTWMAPTLLSRYVSDRYIYPSPEKDPDSFLCWLKCVIKTKRYDVLIVSEEETSMLVAQNLSELSPYIRIPLPRYETITFTRDKFKLLCHAKKMGISCPDTLMVNSLEDAHQSVQKLSFPIVFKPIISAGGHGIRYLFNKNTFDTHYKRMREKYDTFIMQDYIPGDDYYGVSVIFNTKNQMRSAFVHKKLRQLPTTGGVSTCAVSVKFPKLVAIAEALLTSIGWHGVANVEFKVDRRNNIPKLMEVNPRLWGSLQLTVASGINIPYMLYQLAMDGDVSPKFEYKTGVKLHWFMYGDWVHFFANLVTQGKIDVDVFNLFEKNSCHTTWLLSDPLPFFGLPLSLLDYLTSDEMRKNRV
jgi:predicted ATP-grasp superfamily ATP-dependent carboligase